MLVATVAVNPELYQTCILTTRALGDKS